MPVIDREALIADRVKAIRDYHDTAGVQRAELDVSGGVDSAVMLGLLARALGADNITAVYSDIHSSTASASRAREAAAAFGVDLVEIDLTDLFESLVAQMRLALAAAGFDGEAIEMRVSRDPTVLGSIRSTLRAPVGRAFNRMTGGGIRHGTGNECSRLRSPHGLDRPAGQVDRDPLHRCLLCPCRLS